MTFSETKHTVHTVLIVDDEQQILNILQDILEKDAHKVLPATSTEEALAIVASTLPCLILTDVTMPGMDGFALCRRLKQDSRTAHIPVVMVTGRIDDDDIETGILAGAVDYIKKPFDAAEVRMRVRSQIRLHETSRQKKALQEKLSAISSAAKDAIIMMDNEEKIAHWNEAAELMFGHSQKDALGKDLLTLIAPARYHEQFRSAFPHFSKTGQGNAIGKYLELATIRKNGEEFPMELSLSAALINDKWHAIGIIRDITARKNTETQLLLAQKLESVGRLAAGIAHEINTPAQYMGDNTRFLKDSFGELLAVLRMYEELRTSVENDTVTPEMVAKAKSAVEEADIEYLLEEIPPAIEQSLDGTKRISEIVLAMKEFSHPGTGEKVATDINKSLKTTITVCRNEWKYVAEMVMNLDPTLPKIPCLSGELNQAFLNIIVNAAQAMGEKKGETGKGTITVSTNSNGKFAEIHIQDTGPGIPDKIKDRILDPFFTTKEIGKGTGQGLAMVRSTVEDKHKGELAFETKEGQGTKFTIRLPLEADDSAGNDIVQNGEN